MLFSDYFRLQKLQVADLLTGGNLGTAATTVDLFAAFDLTQTTTGQTVTLPAPSLNPQDDYVCFLSNTGTVNFTAYGLDVAPGQVAIIIHNSGTWRVPSQFTAADFWRSVTLALPDGTLDTTEAIRRNGKVGINVDPLIDLQVNGAFGFGINQTDIPNQVANVVLPINPADSSLYFWGQTTVGTKQTLPAPTNVYPQSQVLCLINSGSALAVLDLSAFGIPDATIKPGRAGLFFSGGLGWFPIDFVDAVSTKEIIITKPLVAGNNLITHNLGLLTPFVSSLEVRDTLTGALIAAKLVPGTRAANTFTINVGANVPNADIIIVG